MRITMGVVTQQQIEQKQLGRYVLFRPLFGRSKGSQTYLARETNVDRVVEFHMLDDGLSANPEVQKRFLHECKIISSLDHPNVLKILDFGLVDRHLYYTVPSRNSMRMCKLRENLGGRMDEETTLDIAHALSGAVAHLHEHDVLHRDIDLDTVFMDLDADSPYLADFSLAKNASKGGLTAVGVKRTRKMQIVPEIVRQQPLDQRTDVYLLGILLYSMLTGEDPNSLEAVKARSGSDQPNFELKHLDAFGLGMDPAFSAVIMQMVAPDPENRFQTAELMARSIRKLYDKARVHDMIEQMKSDVMSSQSDLITKSLVEKAEQAKQERERRKEERKRQSEASLSTSAVALPENRGMGLWPIGALLGCLFLALVASFAWHDSVAPPPTKDAPTRIPTKKPILKKTELLDFKKTQEAVLRLCVLIQTKPTTEETFRDRHGLIDKLSDYCEKTKKRFPIQNRDVVKAERLYKESQRKAACEALDRLFTKLYRSLPRSVRERYEADLKGQKAPPPGGGK